MYSTEFNEWWAKRAKTVSKARRAAVKRWCWIGWQGQIQDDIEREEAYRKEFAANLAKDAAAGIDIHSPGYWGDFS